MSSGNLMPPGSMAKRCRWCSDRVLIFWGILPPNRDGARKKAPIRFRPMPRPEGYKGNMYAIEGISGDSIMLRKSKHPEFGFMPHHADCSRDRKGK